MTVFLFYSSSVNRLCPSHIRTKATLPPLAFEFKDLEPIISRDIMEIHHQKHHNTYVVNYNNTLEKLQTAVAKGLVTLPILVHFYRQICLFCDV